MSCGTAVANPTLSPPEIKRPAVSPIPTKDLRNQDSVSKGPIKNKGRKFLKIAFSLVVIVSVSVAGLYFYGTYAPDSGSTDPRALDAAAKELDKSNAVKTDSAAQVVETVFAASDTTGLALILSPSSLKIRRPYFSKLLPYMPAYANDFKDRKLLYANDRYAVYEFATPKGRFTAEFCLGDNGKWMLMRF